MSDAGRKILDGLKDAIAGNYATVTIDGQRWVRSDELARERERCAKLADQEATDAQVQIERNNDYLRSEGRSLNSSSNELCRTRLFAAQRIAASIRTLSPPLASDHPPAGGDMGEGGK